MASEIKTGGKIDTGLRSAKKKREEDGIEIDVAELQRKLQEAQLQLVQRDEEVCVPVSFYVIYVHVFSQPVVAFSFAPL